MKFVLPLIVLVGVLIGVSLVIARPATKTPMPPLDSPVPTLQASSAPVAPTLEKGSNNMKQYTKAEQVIDKNKSYTATLHTTAGDITIALSKETPITTNNFVFLSQNHFYDGVIFHRVIPGFMIQGGDPTGTGMGGPGYQFADEAFTGKYTRGTVAMANSGPNTNGSQFFIMHADYDLPPNYVIFGTTTAGLDVVDKIATAQTGANDRPVNPITIKSVDIVAK